MRILRLSRAHPVLLADSSRGGDWEHLEEQLFARAGYGANNGLTTALRELGHEAAEFVVNHDAALRAWARTHDLPTSGRRWRREAFLARVADVRPDVVFCSDIQIVPSSWLAQLRMLDSPPKLVVWCGVTWAEAEYFRAADLVLTCVPELVSGFEQYGRPVALLRHGFDPRVLDALPPRGAEGHGVVFVGQLQRWPGRHLRRVETLEAVVEAGIDLAIHAPQVRWDPGLASRSAFRQATWHVDRALDRLGMPRERRRSLPALRRLDNWDGRPPPWRSRLLRNHMREAAFGIEMFRVLRDAAITLNVHADVSVDHASNLRLFEATGVGSLLLTEAHANINELFVPDREVVTWTSASDCVAKIEQLRKDPKRVADIAAAGQARTLADHTVRHRAEGFLDRVDSVLS